MPVSKSSPTSGLVSPAPAEPTRSGQGTDAQGPGGLPQQVPARPSALNVPSASGPPPRGARPSAATSFTGPAPRDDKPNYSRAHIGGKPFVPEAGPESIQAFLQNSRTNNRQEFLEKLQQFLGSTLSNNRYESIDQLHQRAENFLHHFEAEKEILARTKAGLKDPQSPVHQQATWMAHLERLNWKENAPLSPPDRELRAREIEPGQGFARGSPFRGLTMTGPIAQTMSMMLAGKQGPLTEQQALAGFELAQTGAVVARFLKMEERVKFKKAYRVAANRQGTNLRRTPNGMDLSEDLGTRQRDAHALPVMTGTSGSASDAALSTKFASKKAGLPWAAPGLNDEQAQRAMADLGLHHFRSDESLVSKAIAERINQLRTAANLAPMHVDSQQVFTHSYPEIDAAVRLTLQGKSGLNEQAMQEVTLASAQRLLEVATELALEAEPPTSTNKPSPA
jgi:hypothetical protein